MREIRKFPICTVVFSIVQLHKKSTVGKGTRSLAERQDVARNYEARKGFYAIYSMGG